MINDFLTNHPAIYAIFGFLYMVAEAAIGKSQPMRAASMLELVWNFALYVRGKFSSKPKGDTEMTTSLNPNTITLQVVVDRPTYEFLGLVGSIVTSVSKGQDAKAALMAAAPALIGSLGDLAKIQGDLALDRASVVEAFSQQAGNLLESFVLLKAAPPVVTQK